MRIQYMRPGECHWSTHRPAAEVPRIGDSISFGEITRHTEDAPKHGSAYTVHNVVWFIEDDTTSVRVVLR